MAGKVDNPVYGLGCLLDTSRFKRELAQSLREDGFHIRSVDIEAFIYGFHGGGMLLSPSVKVKGVEQDINNILVQNALERTKGRGLEITQANLKAPHIGLSNGAYVAPAMMMAKIILAMTNDEQKIIPLNRVIVTDDVQNQDFVGRRCQLPTVVGKDIRPTASGIDEKALEEAFKSYDEAKKVFF